ncbi:MAG: ZIP family metal transporter [Clostridia bacterium]
MTITQILIYTAIPGVIGTGLGGLLGIVFSRKTSSMPKILAFASGIMISIVCFDLVPEGFAQYNQSQISLGLTLLLTILGLLVGMIIVVLISKLLTKKQLSKSTNSINISGLTIFFAILLHNLPEGMAIGSGGENFATSVSLIILIGLHNIPEGMSISVPLYLGGNSKIKSVGLSVISGVSTILGGLLGWYLTEQTSSFSGLCMCIAGGAMLYITFNTLLSEVYKDDENNKISNANFILLGLLVGIGIIYLIDGLI